MYLFLYFHLQAVSLATDNQDILIFPTTHYLKILIKLSSKNPFN